LHRGASAREENILYMAQSVTGFLDLDRIRSVAISEYLLKI
jgi:hypothetical protein